MNPNTRSLRSIKLPLLASVVLMAMVTSASSTTYTWSGGGSDENMGTAANWIGGVAPNAATITNAYVFTGNANLAPFLNSSDWQAAFVTFDANASSFNISGGGSGAERLGMQANSSIIQNSANAQQISAYLLLPTSGTVSIGGTGSGMLSLAGIHFGSASSAVLAVNHDTTFGFVNETGAGSWAGGAIQIYPNINFIFSGNNTGDLGTLKFNVDASGAGGAAANIQTTFSGGMTSSAAILSNDVIFAGSQAMTFNGNYTQLGSANETVTFNDTAGTKLSGTNIQFGAVDGTSSRTITLSVGTGASATISGTITGNASTGATGITKTGAGQLTLSGSNTYNGATTASAGTINLANISALAGSVLTLANGDTGSVSFTVAGTNTYNLGGLAGGRGLALSTNVNGLALNVGSGTASFTGAITGGSTAGLTKSGAGTQILGGANTYSGTTTVTQGTLIIAAGGSVAGGAVNVTGGMLNVSGATGSGAVSISSGAALLGTGTVGGALTVSGAVDPGNAGIGTLNVASNVLWNSGNSWNFELGTAGASMLASGTSDLLDISGNFLKGTGSNFTFDFQGTGSLGWYLLADWSGVTGFSSGDFSVVDLGNGLSGTFVVDNSTSALYLNVVPEPSATGLLVTGLAGVLLWRLKGARSRTA